MGKNSQRKCFVFSCGIWKSRKTGHYNWNTFHFYSSILLAFNIHSFHIWFDIWMSQRALRSKKSSIWKCNERQSNTFWFFLLTMLFYTNQDSKRKKIYFNDGKIPVEVVSSHFELLPWLVFQYDQNIENENSKKKLPYLQNQERPVNSAKSRGW